MKYSLVVLGTALLTGVGFAQTSNDSLIFAYHIARHGPSNGNRDAADIIKDGELDGELSNVGR